MKTLKNKKARSYTSNEMGEKPHDPVRERKELIVVVEFGSCIIAILIIAAVILKAAAKS